MDVVLVVNAGSSSLKFAVDHEAQRLATGHVTSGGLRVEGPDGAVLVDTRLAPAGSGFDHTQAMASVFDWIAAHDAGWRPVAVGHRVVHGGERLVEPVQVSDTVLQALEALVPLAPLHQPHCLAPIGAVRERWPGVPQVACFDTAFHVTMPVVARAFALPREITEAGVRRYGFHGLSYDFVASRLANVLGDEAARGKVIVAHLGSGASLCAMAEGKSIATTMGFSTLDGLMMGTRCGALDPGVLLYLLQHQGMTVAEVSELLYGRSGLLGVSGLSSDIEPLLRSADPRADAAVDLFVHRIVTEIGALAAALGGLDALVFTAGIGENAAPIRARVCAGCGWLGAVIDDSANGAGLELIHGVDSRVRLAIVPTDEEAVIGRYTLRCLEENGTSFNPFAATAVAEKLEAMNTAAFFAERRDRADFDSFDKIMQREGGEAPGG